MGAGGAPRAGFRQSSFAPPVLLHRAQRNAIPRSQRGALALCGTRPYAPPHPLTSAGHHRTHRAHGNKRGRSVASLAAHKAPVPHGGSEMASYVVIANGSGSNSESATQATPPRARAPLTPGAPRCVRTLRSSRALPARDPLSRARKFRSGDGPVPRTSSAASPATKPPRGVRAHVGDAGNVPGMGSRGLFELRGTGPSPPAPNPRRDSGSPLWSERSYPACVSIRSVRRTSMRVMSSPTGAPSKNSFRSDMMPEAISPTGLLKRDLMLSSIRSSS